MGIKTALVNSRSARAVLLLLLAVVTVIASISTLFQYAIQDIERDFQRLDEKISAQFHQSMPNVINSFNDIFTNSENLAALGNEDSSLLEENFAAIKLLEPRMMSVQWYGAGGKFKKSLLTDTHFVSSPRQAELSDLFFRAYQLPQGFSLIELHSKDNQQFSLYYLHNLRRNIRETNSVILVEFDVSDVIQKVSALLPENADYSLAIFDRFKRVIASSGNRGLNGTNFEGFANHVSQSDHVAAIQINNGAWYSSFLLPFSASTSQILEQNDWTVVLHLPAKNFNNQLKNALAFPVLSLAFTLFIICWLSWKYLIPKKTITISQGRSITGRQTSLPEKVFEWSFQDANGGSFVSPGLFSSIGYEFTQLSFNDKQRVELLFEEEDFSRLMVSIHNLAQGSAQQFDCDIKLRHKLGYWVWFNIKGCTDQRDAQGNVNIINGLCIDIAKRKQDEKIILAALEDADKSSHFKSAFISSICYEVRTPMNSISGFLQLMKETPENKNYLAKSRTAINTLLSRFEQINVYSQLEQDSMELDLQPASIEDIIDDVIRELKTQSILGESRFDASIDNTLAALYLVDKNILKLLLNLLVRVTASLGQVDHINFVVMNTGRTKRAHNLRFELRIKCGDVVANRLNQIFARNVEDELSVYSGNIGVDLTVAKKIVQRLESDLLLQTVNGGLTYLFTIDSVIPDVYDRKKIEQASEKAKQEPARKVENITGVKVLVVEDNATNREVITQVLKNMDVVVDIAENGSIGLEKIKQSNDYQIVFMDLQMPVMDGIAATKIIRAELGLTELPIIAVTANQFNIDKQQALAAGMNDFIPKPVDATQLKDAILKWALKKDPVDAYFGIKNIDVDKPNENNAVAEPINPSMTIARMGGDEDMLELIYQRYASDFTHWLEDLTPMLQGERFVEAKLHAHTLKGASGNIDAVKLSSLAADLEQALKAVNVIPKNIDELVKAIGWELTRVNQAIQEYLKLHQKVEQAITIDKEEMLALFDLLSDLLQRRKRIPQEHIVKLRQVLMNTPHSEAFEAFHDACQRFDFEQAKIHLADLKLKFENTEKDREFSH